MAARPPQRLRCQAGLSRGRSQPTATNRFLAARTLRSLTPKAEATQDALQVPTGRRRPPRR
jgi:hypothetical protein